MAATTRLTALIATLALIFSLMGPPRANALDDGAEIALYVVGGIALFVGAIVVGTLLTRDEAKMMLVEPRPEHRDDAVAFGLDCTSPDGRAALACW